MTFSTRFRFTKELDLLLLREAVSVRPFDQRLGAGWKVLATNLVEENKFSRTLTPRAVRDRVQFLLQDFIKTKDITVKVGSKIENINEKANLLQELLLLREEEAARVAESRSSVKIEGHIAENSMHQAVESHIEATTSAVATTTTTDTMTTDSTLTDLSETEDCSMPPSFTPRRGTKRPHEEDVFSFLEEMERNRHWLREEELKIRREELDLQRRREEFDREERRRMLDLQEARFKADSQDRREFMAMLFEIIKKK